MAWLLGDGFDFYASVADVPVNTAVWASALNCFITSGGRISSGNILMLGNNDVFAGNAITVPFANSQTIFVNMGVFSSQAHVNSGTTQLMGFTIRDGSNIQCGVWLRNGGDFVITSGDVGSSVLATSSNLAPSASTWHHIQVKIVIHNTAGSIELRIDGDASASWSATGLNTRNGTSNFYGNIVYLTGTTATHDSVDDFYVFNDQGDAPNTWQGDVYATHHVPITDASVTWDRSGGTNNCLMVDDLQQDGDATYVATNGVNNVDTYALSQLVTIPYGIVAVCARYLVRMDDAGPHATTLQLTSGATTVELPSYASTNSYAYKQAVYTTDPNTSAPWSGDAVNNALLSVKNFL